LTKGEKFPWQPTEILFTWNVGMGPYGKKKGGGEGENRSQHNNLLVLPIYSITSNAAKGGGGGEKKEKGPPERVPWNNCYQNLLHCGRGRKKTRPEGKKQPAALLTFSPNTPPINQRRREGKEKKAHTVRKTINSDDH